MIPSRIPVPPIVVCMSPARGIELRLQNEWCNSGTCRYSKKEGDIYDKELMLQKLKAD